MSTQAAVDEGDALEVRHVRVVCVPVGAQKGVLVVTVELWDALRGFTASFDGVAEYESYVPEHSIERAFAKAHAMARRVAGFASDEAPKAPPTPLHTAPEAAPSAVKGYWWDDAGPMDWRRLALAAGLSTAATHKLWEQVCGLVGGQLSKHVATPEEYQKVYSVLVGFLRARVAEGQSIPRPDDLMVAKAFGKGGSIGEARERSEAHARQQTTK